MTRYIFYRLEPGDLFLRGNEIWEFLCHERYVRGRPTGAKAQKYGTDDYYYVGRGIFDFESCRLLTVEEYKTAVLLFKVEE